jgi:hypothetical protein
MKNKMLFLLLGLVLTVTAQAACHEVVDRSTEHPNTTTLKIDELCIDENDFVTLLKKGREVYSFQAIFTITPYRYGCGGREGNRCGNFGSQLYLNYLDNRVEFEAHVTKDGDTNFGAQPLTFDDELYKFWVKGRR